MIPCKNCITYVMCKQRVENVVKQLKSRAYRLPVYIALINRCSIFTEYIDHQHPKRPEDTEEYDQKKFEDVCEYFNVGVNMMTIPCKDCICLASCRGLVNDCNIQDPVSYTTTIANLASKCTLINPHILEKAHFTTEGGETIEYDNFNYAGVQKVISTILE